MTTSSDPLTGPITGPPMDVDRALGAALRRLRHERGLTLVQLAAASALSHPFLSQLETGRARPSMRSLFAIAQALGSTQQELLALAASLAGGIDGAGAPPQTVGVDGARSGAQLLLHGPGVDVTEFSDLPAQHGDWFCHERAELLYAVAGVVELQTTHSPDVAPQTRLLPARAWAEVAGGVHHRYRRVGTEHAVVLAVHHVGAGRG